VLFRCSQIYTPDVLKDLKIKTVVDLRGRAETKKKKKAPQEQVQETLGSQGLGHGHAPPPLLTHEQIEALQANGSSGADTSDDMLVTTLKRQGSIDSLSSAELDEPGGLAAKSTKGSSSSNNGNGNGGTVRKVKGADELQAGLAEEDYGLMPETENFNLIPTKEFGLAMLRMPWRVWRKSLLNLATLRDARRPFVDAFADEQLLGFTRYYIIILEHAKKNIAGVMRVFAKTNHMPALVHCAHGKDRTGVVIMLLLMVCGVPHEAIVQDYVQSEVELRKYRESLGLPDTSGATGAVIPLTDVIIASTQETLRAVLAYMDSTYITVDNYLMSCGLTTQEIEAIRNNLLKPGAPAEAPAGEQQQKQRSPQEAQEAAEKAITTGKGAAIASVGSGDEL
jgi:protein tyrosine/serine phosphatase